MLKVADCVRLPDGRIGRVRGVLAPRGYARYLRITLGKLRQRQGAPKTGAGRRRLNIAREESLEE